MRVSLVNVNLVSPDAVGQCILNQIRFFLRRGDDVRVYIMHPAEDVPAGILDHVEVVSLAGLMDPGATHFHQSDLYVYHYQGRYELIETLPGLDRGAVIFYYHNVTPPEFWGSEEDQEQLAFSAQSVGAFARYADLIVTESQFNAEQLAEDHACDPDRIMVLPLAVSLDHFAPGPKNIETLRRHNLGDSPVILFVGRMAGNKRIDLLVEALPLIQKRVPGTKLLLVGDERGNTAIQQVVAAVTMKAIELGVESSVTFVGRVADLQEYYRTADVYASASLHEGFGVPLIEAMASGRPVVASEIPAHSWVLDGAGLLTEPGNAVDMANKLIRVLTDDTLYGDLVNRGKARAQGFSIAQYEVGWAEAVMRATEWLPEQPDGYGGGLTGRAGEEDLQFSGRNGSTSLLPATLQKELVRSADIVDREFVTKSGVPVIGPLIVWIRHNLTSHVVAYLQPTLDRQVRYNRLINDALLWLGSALPAHQRPDPQVGVDADGQLQGFEHRLELLDARLREAEARLAEIGTAPGISDRNTNGD